MSSPTVYVITGANRGLGLGYARFLLQRDPSAHIIGTARDPAAAKALNQLKAENEGRVEVIKLDTASGESAKEAAQAIEQIAFAKDGVDVLLANAGVAIGGFEGFSSNSVQATKDNLETNLFGVMYSVEAFLPLLQRKTNGKKQIFVTSSIVGSIGGPLSGTEVALAYSISKTAVNMFTVKLGRQVAKEGFTVVPHHPGYVKTEMTGGDEGPGDLTVEESVTSTIDNVFFKVTPDDNTKFYNYDGQPLPW